MTHEENSTTTTTTTTTAKHRKSAWPCRSTLDAAVSDAFADLQTLAEEMREAFDNMPESLQSSPYADGLTEAADSLEYMSEPSVPEMFKDANEVTIEWIEDRTKNLSRADRCNNAVNALRAALEYCEELRETLEAEQRNAAGDEPETDKLDREMRISAVDQFVDELNDVIDTAEGVEFPRRGG